MVLFTGSYAIPWPSMSPNLNPIEDVWSLMVHELEEELRQPARQLNQDELWAAVRPGEMGGAPPPPRLLPEPGGLDEAAAGAVLRGSGPPHPLLNRSCFFGILCLSIVFCL